MDIKDIQFIIIINISNNNQSIIIALLHILTIQVIIIQHINIHRHIKGTKDKLQTIPLIRIMLTDNSQDMPHTISNNNNNTTKIIQNLLPLHILRNQKKTVARVDSNPSFPNPFLDHLPFSNNKTHATRREI